jgi:serine/threonine protein kinase
MGTIYRAYDNKRGDHVALKMSKQPSLEPWRFAFETHLARTIEHPFVAGYVADGLTDEGPYLALEWLDGEDLSERLERGPLSLREALEVIRRVARALCPLHEAGVVHRDLKPANVFLCDQRADRARLLDFGVARPIRRREEHEDDHTGTGISVGTPAYMAPEQIFAGTVDDRTDVYALGAILFECLTGAPPFAAKNFASSVLRILNDPPPRLADAWVECPSDVEALVARMLAKTPNARPTAHEVWCEIEALLETLDGVLERTSCTRMKVDVHADTAAA